MRKAQHLWWGNRMRKLTVLAFGAALAAASLALADDAKPQYGAFGLDLAGRDMATRPGDNFFRYGGGTWLDHATIPSDKPAITLRLLAADRTEMQVHEILETAAAQAGHEPTTVAGKVGA